MIKKVLLYISPALFVLTVLVALLLFGLGAQDAALFGDDLP